MSKLSDRIIQVLIRKDVSIHAQLFRFMSLLGTIAMAVGGVYTLAEGMEIKNVAALFAGALFMGMLFWAGNKFQQYDLCSFILMSGLNGIFLPVTFLRSGGLKSGMPLWFVLGFISLFFLLRGKSLVAGTVITIIADAYCFYTAYVHPERITYMESESVVYGDIIVSAVITIFLTCAFMFIQITLSEYQRKENEKQQAELVAAMNTQSRFLANMSHEIRTPLNAIVGFSGLLVEADGATREERREYKSIIENNNCLLLQLISDVLDLSKIEAGTLEFVYTDVDVHELFLSLEDTFRWKKKDDGVLIRYHCQMPECRMQTDRSRLSQVVINLLNNSVKFTSSGSIEFGYYPQTDGFLYFYVTDTGCGIPESRLEDVFGRFVKLNSFVQGTGLGLSICRTIVEKMGGKIGVDSRVGEGSTFWFTLPYVSRI